MTYSVFSLIHKAYSTASWPGIIPNKAPASNYDIVIVGGGAHGLATAYYLYTRFGISNIAVVESGWLGGGNTARNTTIVRSDYLLKPSFKLKNFALGLWETLGSELGFNLMYSPRGYEVLLWWNITNELGILIDRSYAQSFVELFYTLTDLRLRYS